ncbi:hypothetical protein E3T48_02285 [Cryobacterium fucosi]|uniref:Uncharacterized protein n=1 Tax=Cryobacterium fucosi TaxID=1259157 RepID=A0A4R9BGL6_9MICO|nr:hypothetical protein E3T48_02285 [Cryobacterium fucosi]
MSAAINSGAAVSVTARMDPAVKRAIAAIPDNAWEAIEYTDAIYDEVTKTWISTAEIAEIPFTAFTSWKQSERITGRLVVRRIPELNKKDLEDPTLYDFIRGGPGALHKVDREGICSELLASTHPDT